MSLSYSSPSDLSLSSAPASVREAGALPRSRVPDSAGGHGRAGGSARPGALLGRRALIGIPTHPTGRVLHPTSKLHGWDPWLRAGLLNSVHEEF